MAAEICFASLLTGPYPPTADLAWSYVALLPDRSIAQQFLLICPYFPTRKDGLYHDCQQSSWLLTKPGFWLFLGGQWSLLVSQECKIRLSSPEYVYKSKEWKESLYNGRVYYTCSRFCRGQGRQNWSGMIRIYYCRIPSLTGKFMS